MVWAAGQQLQGGRYVIQKKIGQGGFGITYKAQHRNLQQYVVIKTINDTLRNDPEYSDYVTRFIQEGQILAQLSKNPHPHIVRVIDLFEEYGLWCMVMEYIEGEDLSSRVAKRGVLPETEALRYIQQIGEALTVVHKQGLLHRDVKPQNIMLRSGTSEAVLIDFGIAREFIPGQTQSHTQFVSYGFAPIEQCYRRGKRGAYTDVYALAATLYVLLTGYIRPDVFQHRLPDSMDRDFDIRNHNNDPLVPPKAINSNISDKVNQAIFKGLALQPEKRPQSMQEWLKLLGFRNASVTTPQSAIPQVPIPKFRLQPQTRTISWNLGWLTTALSRYWNSHETTLLSIAGACGYLVGTLIRISSTFGWLTAFWITQVILGFISTPLAASMAIAVAGITALLMYMIWEWDWINFLPGLLFVYAWPTVFILAAMFAYPNFTFTAYSINFIFYLLSLYLVISSYTDWKWGLRSALNKLLQSFSKFQTFAILLGISWLGLTLGWSLYHRFPIYQSLSEIL